MQCQETNWTFPVRQQWWEQASNTGKFYYLPDKHTILHNNKTNENHTHFLKIKQLPYKGVNYRSRHHTSTTTMTRVACYLLLLTGMQVNTRYINSTRGTSSNNDHRVPLIGTHCLGSCSKSLIFQQAEVCQPVNLLFVNHPKRNSDFQDEGWKALQVMQTLPPVSSG